jgi:CRP-like cAMP-binding protein
LPSSYEDPITLLYSPKYAEGEFSEVPQEVSKKNGHLADAPCFGRWLASVAGTRPAGWTATHRHDYNAMRERSRITGAGWIYMYRSHKEEEARLLSMVDIPEPLSKEELEELSSSYPQCSIEAGHLLYTPGDPSERLFILKRGKVRLYRVAEGHELTLAVLEEGKLFGEMALTAQHLRQAYAQAMEPSVVLSMSPDDLEKLILRHPEVGLVVARLLSERLRLYEKRLEDISLKQVPARLASLLLILCESEGVMSADNKQIIRIATHYTHDHLGTMIGASRASVTHALGHLRELGAVQVCRRRIYLVDTEVLERVANGAP